MLRGASAEARDELVAALGQGSGDATSLGEELFGASSLFRREAALRRVATDASVEADAKAGLVGDLFRSAVGSDALDLLQQAARHRWTSPRDLADVLEHLGVVAVIRGAGDDGSRISDELFSVRRLVDGNDDLRSALSDPARSAADKGGLLGRLLEGKVQHATLLLVAQAVSGAHGAIDTALEDFQHLAAEANDELLATVRTARELGDGERDRLVRALSQQYGTTVHLQVVVDSRVIGGLRVEIGDDVIDGTVSGRLEDAQRRLAG
jgi:F-type H+-transporting ATPase subunit delta